MSPPKDDSTRTISVVMAITLLGKVLGLLRDRLLAVHYGTGMEANAFYTASRIPRVFFDAVFASAIAACFIPVFSEYLTKKGKKAAFDFSSAFITVMALLTAVLMVLGIVFAQPLVQLFADGYDAQTAALTVRLTQLMFPTVLFTGVAFSFVGILQSLGNFSVPALISTVSNLVVIFYFYVLDRRFGIYGLALAFLVGWLLQAAVQVPSLHRLGYRYRPRLDLRSEGMGKVFALMLPVMVSTWVQPINLTINSKFGSRLYGGSGVTAIEISTNLYLIIVGVFVLSITNVIFPKLSRLTAGAQDDAFRDTLRQTIRGMLFFLLPMSAGLMVVSRPLVSFIYGGGLFDDFSVSITAQGLFWVSLGMVGYGVQNVLSRAYFARQEGRIPLIAGILSIGVNVVLCMALTDTLAVQGLAIASAVSATVYALLLLIPMQHKEGAILTPALLSAFVRMLACTLLMALGAWGVQSLAAGLGTGKGALLLSLALTAVSGGGIYFLSALLLGLDEARLALSAVKRILKRG